MNSEDGQVYSVCILQFFCFTKYNRIQNINKQNVNVADETLTDYSFLSSYHHTKSKSYLKRRYRIRHWIPMFIVTPCIPGITISILIFEKKILFCLNSMYKIFHGQRRAIQLVINKFLPWSKIRSWKGNAERGWGLEGGIEWWEGGGGGRCYENEKD